VEERNRHILLHSNQNSYFGFVRAAKIEQILVNVVGQQLFADILDARDQYRLSKFRTSSVHLAVPRSRNYASRMRRDFARIN
jgi:hypothetical protein